VLPEIPPKPEKQTVGDLGEPKIYNFTDEPEKVLTLKDIFPEPAKKKGKKKKSKKKGAAKKKLVP